MFTLENDDHMIPIADEMSTVEAKDQLIKNLSQRTIQLS